MENLDRHFGQAAKDIEEIKISSDKASKRARRLDNFDFEELAPDTPTRVIGPTAAEQTQPRTRSGASERCREVPGQARDGLSCGKCRAKRRDVPASPDTRRLPDPALEERARHHDRALAAGTGRPAFWSACPAHPWWRTGRSRCFPDRAEPHGAFGPRLPADRAGHRPRAARLWCRWPFQEMSR